MLRATIAALLLAAIAPASACASDTTAPIRATASPRGLYGETTTPPNPHGTVLVIHGGGWQWVGRKYVELGRPDAQRIQSYGWRTVNVDYRAGAASIQDVIAWYDWVKRSYSGPICALGGSAGAHLALMLAAKRPVACVIGHAAITDLRHIRGSKDAKLIREKFIPPSFGRRLLENSPIAHPARPQTRVLLANSERDTIGPCHQLDQYKLARPATRTVCLPAGHAAFTHANVDQGALTRLHAAERRLLTEVAGL